MTTTDKGAITRAVKETFDQLGDTFHATSLIKIVRAKSETMAFDSTILRLLRRIRQDEPQKYGWKCIDKEQAIYQKLLNTENQQN